MSLTIGAPAAYVPPGPAPGPSPSAPAAPSSGGDIVALSVAAQASLASSALLNTLQQTDAALGSAAGSIGTGLTV